VAACTHLLVVLKQAFDLRAWREPDALAADLANGAQTPNRACPVAV